MAIDAVRYFLRKRSSRTTSPPPAGLSGPFVGGLAASSAASDCRRGWRARHCSQGGRCAPALCFAGGRAAPRSLPASGPRVPASASAAAPRSWLAGAVLDLLELQAELHRRIEEAFDRRERNGQALRDAAERQADLEALLGHDQVPELVLQDDGHLLGILRAACAATAARRRRGCRRRCRNDARPAGRSWRRRSARCAPPRAARPGPEGRSGCDRRPWGIALVG